MALVANSFRNPLGAGNLIDSATPNNGGYYDIQNFGVNNHLGEDWNREVNGARGNADLGEPVYSIANGEVVSVFKPGNTTTGWGNTVVIKHTLPDGSVVYSQYSHLQTGSITVQVGDSVTYGQNIAGIGSTGNSEAAHLHFEIKTFFSFRISLNNT